MKHHSPTILQETKTTIADVVRWTQELDRLHARLAPRFARPEPHRRALAFLHGILSNTPRKNGWQLAEHAREARPDGMQRLLNSAVWDADLVRDDLCTYILEQLGLVIDETSVRKRSNKIGRSRHAALRHNWPAGKLSGWGLCGLRRLQRPHVAGSGMVSFRRWRAYFPLFYAPIASRSKK